MHHVALEAWSRGKSPLHRRDARAKAVILAVFLVVVATTPATAWIRYAAYTTIAISGVAVSRLPAHRLAARAAIVLPFSAVFALFMWAGGRPELAAAVVVKSYLSALAALLIMAATPLPAFLRALEWMRAPALIVLVAQFVYRYLFVISEQAQHMRAAARARGGRHGFRGAASAVSVLFAKSYSRAEGIHRAMLARGFAGTFPALEPNHWHAADVAFIALVCGLSIGARFAG